MNRVTSVFTIFVAAIAADISDCDFYNTVNVTGIELINESYVYKNVTIPENKTKEYNYTMALFTGKTPASNHRRGCLCQVAKCVLLCCEPNRNLPNAYVNIIIDEKEVYVNALEEYVVQSKAPQSCDNFFVAAQNTNFAIKEV